jgi:hypothetical protein
MDHGGMVLDSQEKFGSDLRHTGLELSGRALLDRFFVLGRADFRLRPFPVFRAGENRN